ncbi:MAG: GGDEF domain-containing protein [Rhodospirillales bacterium]|nr:GGDEF domain-containing protein [Rhodospirillales bacterium]
MTTNFVKYNTGMPKAGQVDGKNAVLAGLLRRPRDNDGHQVPHRILTLLEKAGRMLARAEQRLNEQTIRISQLENLATTDELTGVLNRRGFCEAFSRELARCERNLSDGGLLLLIDVDNFQTIQAEHGFLAGDACLRLVGHALAGSIRLMDAAGRLEDDNFVLLLSNTTQGSAAARAQELVRQLNNLALAWHGEELPVRASVCLRAYGKGDTVQRFFGTGIESRKESIAAE